MRLSAILLRISILGISILSQGCAKAQPEVNDARSPVVIAVIYHNYPRLIQLLDSSVRPQVLAVDSALVIAVSLDDPRATRILLAHGANPNCEDFPNGSPVGVAAAEGSYVLKDLLRAGAADSIRGADGKAPIHYAAYADHLDAVIALLDHGVDPNKADKYGEGPLTSAIWSGKADMVHLLLERKANPNQQDSLHNTPLLLAFTLLEGGNDLEGQKLTDFLVFNDSTPQSRKVAFHAIIHDLLGHGANPSTLGFYGGTLLHNAVQKCDLWVATELLKFGADATIRDKKGRTPLEVAKEKNCKEIVALLSR